MSCLASRAGTLAIRTSSGINADGSSSSPEPMMEDSRRAFVYVGACVPTTRKHSWMRSSPAPDAARRRTDSRRTPRCRISGFEAEVFGWHDSCAFSGPSAISRLRIARTLRCRKRPPALLTQGRRLLEAAPRSSFSQDLFVVRAAFHSLFALTAYAHCCRVPCGTAQRQFRGRVNCGGRTRQSLFAVLPDPARPLLPVLAQRSEVRIHLLQVRVQCAGSTQPWEAMPVFVKIAFRCVCISPTPAIAPPH